MSTSPAFGSNALASSWEAFRRAIQNMITLLSQQTDLTEKHKDLLNIFCWVKESPICPDLVSAFPCDLNCGVLDEFGDATLMAVNIYADNILATAAF